MAMAERRLHYTAKSTADIARSQSQYLNKLKENLKCDEVIINGVQK